MISVPDLGISEFEKLDEREVLVLMQLSAMKAVHKSMELSTCECSECDGADINEVLENLAEITATLDRAKKLLIAFSLRRAHKAGGSDAVDRVIEFAVPF